MWSVVVSFHLSINQFSIYPSPKMVTCLKKYPGKRSLPYFYETVRLSPGILSQLRGTVIDLKHKRARTLTNSNNTDENKEERERRIFLLAKEVDVKTRNR